jgi:hypothetical protein
MRCLHCGNALPLLKRLSGGEFCSDAHRREYQQKYSQLALARLLQAKPPGLDSPEQKKTFSDVNPAVPVLPPLGQSHSPASPRVPVATPLPASPQPHVAGVAVISPLRAAHAPEPGPVDRPAGSPAALKEPPLPPPQAKAEVAAPAEIAGAFIQKPAIVSRQAVAMVTPESESFATAAAPHRPQYQAALAPAGLVHAGKVAWEPACQARDSAVHTLQDRVEQRSFVPAPPVMDFEMSRNDPGAWNLADQSVEMPVILCASPAAPRLWQAPPCDFPGSAIALGEFAELPLPTVGFEEQRVRLETGPPPEYKLTEAVPVDPTPADLVPSCRSPRPLPDGRGSVPAADSTEPRASASGQTLYANFRNLVLASDASRVCEPLPPTERAIPDPVLDPVPMVLQAMAAGGAKPVQVFTSWLPGRLAPHISPSEALPLRPVMILAPLEAAIIPAAAPARSGKRTANGRVRKADVRILAPEKPQPQKTEAPRAEPVSTLGPPPSPAPVQPSTPMPITLAKPTARPDLGLPELHLQPSGGSTSPQVWRVVAAVAGVLILVVALLLFTSGKSEPKPQQPVAAAVNDWIADFAPDAKRQRKVSVLRSSAQASDYRVEFEAAIQIKALGWVYRAQDPKNFYVSKIELQKPGQDPVFVVAHYAVINGVDQPRAEVPLPVRVPVGGSYRIRLEAAGNRFITWVQDQKVDEWTDERLKSGGAGLYSEGIEQADLHGVFHVVPLETKEVRKK